MFCLFKNKLWSRFMIKVLLDGRIDETTVLWESLINTYLIFLAKNSSTASQIAVLNAELINWLLMAQLSLARVTCWRGLIGNTTHIHLHLNSLQISCSFCQILNIVKSVKSVKGSEIAICHVYNMLNTVHIKFCFLFSLFYIRQTDDCCFCCWCCCCCFCL